ncbi:hypothetical protein GCM10020366_07600 [Saccharopolyspora gregorii]|uniref:Uncharacterized protein n=1 Tax=Saccharopolyspora gregorii TaxID=33914 RepID=A0ABP6RML0_9PSEU
MTVAEVTAKYQRDETLVMVTAYDLNRARAFAGTHVSEQVADARMSSAGRDRAASFPGPLSGG